VKALKHKERDHEKRIRKLEKENRRSQREKGKEEQKAKAKRREDTMQRLLRQEQLLDKKSRDRELDRLIEGRQDRFQVRYGFTDRWGGLAGDYERNGHEAGWERSMQTDRLIEMQRRGLTLDEGRSNLGWDRRASGKCVDYGYPF